MTEALVQDMAFHLVIVPFAIMAGGMALLFLAMLLPVLFIK